MRDDEMGSTYDSRTKVLLPALNALLTRHYLPTVAHPSEITTSLIIALYESLVQSRLSAINRRDKTQAGQIRNVKLLLGEMVMAGWDVGMIDPLGVVEREETSLMDMIEILVEVGRENYGPMIIQSMRDTVDNARGKELSTISEFTSSEVSDETSDAESSISAVRAIHQRADAILSRIHSLNPSLRSPSPTGSVVSRGTQTSPPLPQVTQRTKQTPRRIPQKSRKLKKTVKLDETDSGIPSSIPLSYSSDSSTSTARPIRTRLRNHIFVGNHSKPIISISSPRPRRHSHSSSSETFLVDSPYTAALRRRRQKAIDSLRRPKKHKIKILGAGKDVANSTFAEDSDPPTPQSMRILPVQALPSRGYRSRKSREITREKEESTE